eukprot:6246801-Ditylum_brightwellii.AAC.1
MWRTASRPTQGWAHARTGWGSPRGQRGTSEQYCAARLPVARGSWAYAAASCSPYPTWSWSRN